MLLSLVLFPPLWGGMGWGLYAQAGTWVWMKGSNKLFDTGYYGIRGIASPLNEPPYRYEAAHWTDRDGNFWMFGGYYDNTGKYTELNDLWKYDSKTNDWTWVNGGKYQQQPFGNFGTKGIPSTNNFPSIRGMGSATWTDKNGDLWMYGGGGCTIKHGDGTLLNDLWKYHIATNEWTWVNGDDTGGTAPIYGIMTISSAANTPGGRYECKSTWVDDSNNLWLFGGYDTYQNAYCDLWKYNININEWTWMKGVIHKNDYGSYGTMGVENSTNYPSGRWTVSRWKDKDGNFYIYGGQDFATFQNDIWKYNPKTNNWTWIFGNHYAVADTGKYIAKCQKGNSAPGVADNETVQNGGCNEWFWSFSGAILDDHHAINGLWLFNLSSMQWTWVSGNAYTDTSSHYGNLGVPDKLNVPPIRAGCCMWSDANNNIWIFGGNTYFNYTNNTSNDLWEFIVDTSCFHPQVNTTSKFYFRDTIVGCKDSVRYKVQGIHIVSIAPPAYTNVYGDSEIVFKPQDTTHYVIRYYCFKCNGWDTSHFKIYVVPCPVPPPTKSYVQSYITTNGIWNIINKPVPLNVTLYDALGQVLYKDNSYQNTLDTRKWAAGVYLYQVIDGNGNKYVGKMVVVR